jgi:hypothetical protein
VSLHLPGLADEAALVPLPVFDTIRDHLGFTTTHHGTLLVAGEHGTGKRVATLTVLDEQDIPVLALDTPPAATPTELTRALHQALHTDRDTLDLREMQDEIVETLHGRPGIIAFTHAEDLSHKAAAQLQYLHSRPGAQWSLVLVAGPGIERLLAATARLRGDVTATVEVARLRGEDLMRFVRALHPLFGAADTDLLVAIDQQVCKGLPKNWARFLQVALDLHRRTAPDPQSMPVLDTRFARATTHLLPRTRPTRSR